METGLVTVRTFQTQHYLGCIQWLTWDLASSSVLLEEVFSHNEWNHNECSLSVAKTKTGNLFSQINVEHFSDLPQEEQANTINSAFLEPLEEYKLAAPLERLPLEDIREILSVSEERVQRPLLKINPTKAAGRDMTPNRATQGVRRHLGLSDYGDSERFLSPTAPPICLEKLPTSHPCRKRNQYF